MSSVWFQTDTKLCWDISRLFKDYLVTFSLPPSSPHLHTLHPLYFHTHPPSLLLHYPHTRGVTPSLRDHNSQERASSIFGNHPRQRHAHPSIRKVWFLLFQIRCTSPQWRVLHCSLVSQCNTKLTNSTVRLVSIVRVKVMGTRWLEVISN